MVAGKGAVAQGEGGADVQPAASKHASEGRSDRWNYNLDEPDQSSLFRSATLLGIIASAV